MEEHRNKKKLGIGWRTILEVMFILFLFYSNLLMGEFTHSGSGQSKGLLWAIQDIFTITNFVIGMALAICGQLILDFFRRRL
jgi:ABC-type cobalamin transport system permease subunit